MNIKNMEVGIRVKISEDPSFSIRNHGSLSGYKRSLAGSIQVIKKISSDMDRLYIYPPKNCRYNTISFNRCDLINLNEMEKPNIDIKPELFDPNQLDI